MSSLRNKKIKDILKERTWGGECMCCGEQKVVSSCGHCSIILCKECMKEHLDG